VKKTYTVINFKYKIYSGINVFFFLHVKRHWVLRKALDK